MKEKQAVQAVYDTIDDSKSSLVSGIEQNGREREILYLSNTILQALPLYYAILIDCVDAREYNHPEGRNSDKATPYVTEYDIVIAVADNALFEDGEALYGVTAHNNFRVFCDPIVALFRRDQKWFPTASADPRFRLRVDPRMGRQVRKTNELPDPVGDGTYMLGSAISFTLVECDE